VTREPATAAPGPDRPRAAWWEVLGAWLHVWTPPRGVAVPPVPWRWVAAAGAGLVALVAVVVLVVAPKVDEGKRRGFLEKANELVAKDRQRLPIVAVGSAWAMQKGKITIKARVDEDTLSMNIKPATN